MDDIDNNNKWAIEGAALNLFDNLRGLNSQQKELVVRIEVQVGGRKYSRSLRSPVLEGDEKIVTHEAPQRDF